MSSRWSKFDLIFFFKGPIATHEAGKNFFPKIPARFIARFSVCSIAKLGIDHIHKTHA